MNLDEALSLPAGRELDALVAQKVMGLPEVTLQVGSLCPKCGGETRFCGTRSRCLGSCNEWIYSPYLPYSEEIELAWQVLEKVAGPKGCSYKLYSHDGCGAEPCEVWCEIHIGVKVYEGMGGCLVDDDWEPNAVPVAICRAAIQAVEWSGPIKPPAREEA